MRKNVFVWLEHGGQGIPFRDIDQVLFDTAPGLNTVGTIDAGAAKGQRTLLVNPTKIAVLLVEPAPAETAKEAPG